MTRTAGLVALLALAGAAWGATQPLAKIAVSEGYRHFGLIFWQSVLMVLILGTVSLARGRRLPLAPRHLRTYTVIALIGSVLPGITSYSAAIHLPSGVLSILLSSIPMLAFPIALALGNERFRWRRIVGLSLGFAGVLLLVLPDTTLPDPAKAIWIPVALVSSLLYACEGNYVARWGTGGLGAVEVLLGASLVGAAVTLPMTLLSGQFIDPRGPWGAPDLAIVASALCHALAYTIYVWLVGQAGAVFAVQVSYLVTLFGVTWAMLFLGERYSGFIWAALALMLVGLFFVQPRPRGVLAGGAPPGDTGLPEAGRHEAGGPT